MSSITLKAVEKWFGDVQVIKGVDLAIDEGEFVIFVGPSGCGKSTLLRMIAGLEETSRGQIMVGDRDATAEPPSKRGLAMVFQSYALYPHMSVRDNVGFPLKSAGLPKSDIEAKIKTVRSAAEGEDLAAIKGAISELEQAMHKASEAIYKDAGGDQPGAGQPGDGETAGAGAGAGDEEIKDADFEVK